MTTAMRDALKCLWPLVNVYIYGLRKLNLVFLVLFQLFLRYRMLARTFLFLRSHFFIVILSHLIKRKQTMDNDVDDDDIENKSVY